VIPQLRSQGNCILNHSFTFYEEITLQVTITFIPSCHIVTWHVCHAFVPVWLRAWLRYPNGWHLRKSGLFAEQN